MYELYIANKNYSSWSLRPWLLMRQAGLAFQEHVVPFGPGSNWEAFRRFSPSGKVPCLVLGEQVVWDSLGIAEFLAERHEGVWPADPAARAWARCAAAEMHSGFTSLRTICPMNCGLRVRLHGLTAELQQDLARVQELWQEGLERFGGPFLAGASFTAVDAFFAPVAFRIQTYALPLAEPASAYAHRLLNLPPMREWAAAALAEPWIEPGHEADCLKHGAPIADLRQMARP